MRAESGDVSEAALWTEVETEAMEALLSLDTWFQ
jgi:hypothetical protein